MVIEAGIQLASRIVGKIAVEVEGIRGTGGYHKPTLVFPVIVTLEESLHIFVWDLLCTLYFSGKNIQLGQSILVNNRFYPNYWREEWHVSLTTSDLCLIEEQRHKSQDKDVWFTLHFEGRVAGSYKVWNSMISSGQQQEIKHPPFPGWESLGLIKKVAFFDSVQFNELRVRIPASDWVNRVLPGLGFNRLRLIEVVIPEKGTLFGAVNTEKIMQYFDEAIRSFNFGHYTEAVQKCRSVLEELEEIIEEAKEEKCKKIATTIANKVGWQEEDARVEGIQHCCQALRRLLNKASHPREITFSFADARFCLLLLSALLEYLGRLTGTLPLTE